jgi:4-hydroxy-tetrahydrodipicolinate synthase
MLPPFYYKGVSDEGLFRNFAEVIERVGSGDLRIYLYHIPPVSQVGIPVELVERLTRAYPEIVAGIKDSSGDWDNTRALIQCGGTDFRVFSGSESFLQRRSDGFTRCGRRPRPKNCRENWTICGAACRCRS